MLDTVNLFDGIVSYDTLSNCIDDIFLDDVIIDDIFIDDDSLYLTEDLLQICFFDGDYTLDVGWYPDGDIDGKFRIVIIHCYDWSNPLFSRHTRTLKSLIDIIQQAVDEVYKHKKL